MLGLERRQKIMEILHRDNKVYVSKLAKLFNVTEETVRRDLEKLESQNLITRSYGGAVLAESTSEDLSFNKRSSLNSESKQLIALKAYDLISDGDTVMVDSSTTCQMLLQQMKGKKNITVITNSIRLMNDFMGTNFTMICTGGTIRTNSCALTGPTTSNTLKTYYVDFALISCKGLDQERGITESNESEGKVKQLMMQQARRVILLADHSKFDKTAFVRCGEFENITHLVTDTAPSDSWQQFLTEKKVRLIY